jgi:hypothetical protein
MAMNKQRRTSNINNIITYDTLGNVIIPSNLTVEGLGAGFVTSDVNGLFSVDTTIYQPALPSQSGNAGKFLTTNGSVLSWAVNDSSNIYTSDGTLTANRTLSQLNYGLSFTSTKLAGTTFSVTHNQTQTNSSDASDAAMLITYNHNAISATNQLVSRAFQLTVNNNIIGGGIMQNLRCFNLAAMTSSASTTSDVDLIYLERGAGTVGTVTNYRAIRVATYMGTNRGGLMMAPIAGTNASYINLGSINIPTGLWGIYQSEATYNNYFNGSVLIGTSTVSTHKLDVNGSVRGTIINSPSFKNPAGINGVMDFFVVGAPGDAGYQKLSIVAGGTPFSTMIQSSGDGGGSRGFILSASGPGGEMYFETSNSQRWILSGSYNVLGAGHLLPSSDNLYTIGATSTRISAIYSYKGFYSTNVQIGGSTEYASSLLSMDSTTKGFLPPRMTAAQKNAIASPSTGLVIYQTDSTEGLYQYKSTGWSILDGGAATGITSLNSLTSGSQLFATGTVGSDFNIVSASNTHTFNIPTASGSNRGLLSSTDWTTFNSKQNALTNPVTGTGNSGYVTKFSGTSTVNDSAIYNHANGIIINDVNDNGGALQVKNNGFGGVKIFTSNSAFGLAIQNQDASLKSWDFSPSGTTLYLNESGISNRMAFLAGGQIGIGQTSVASGFLVEVNGGLKTNGTVRIPVTSSMLKVNASGDIVAATLGVDYIGTGTISANLRFTNNKGVLFEQTNGTTLGSIFMSINNAVSISNNSSIGVMVYDDQVMLGGRVGIGHAGNIYGGASTALSMSNSLTTPSSSFGDSFIMYSTDIVAGNAAPHFRTENGGVIKLYQETTSVGNSIFSQGGGNSVLDDSTFDGYTLRQIVKALRNLGILQ